MFLSSCLAPHNIPVVVMNHPESFLSGASLMRFNMFDNPDFDSLQGFQMGHDGRPQQEFAGDAFQAGNIFFSSPEEGFVAWTSRMQRFGETAFVAAIVLAMIQAAVALHQYRSNPSGELIFPQGLTFGVEEGNRPSAYNRSGNQKSTVGNDILKANPLEKLKSLNEDANRLYQEQNGGQKEPRLHSLILFKANRMLLLLFPWIATRINYLLVKNSHLFHIFFIFSLASAFDFGHPRKKNINDSDSPSIIRALMLDEKEEYKVVVIGDSLAIGIGSVECWDINKNQTTPKYRVEKLSLDDKSENHDSPVFSQVFAQTLSKRLKRRIRWRSAGVDGGDVDDIHHFCAGVIQEESEKDKSPDIVVVLCGINDLKKAVSNPFKSKSARGFRASMEKMIDGIHQYAPDASIVFPALPVQLFHKNSVVNILPLSFFLDAIIGFWDSQKKLVADNSSSDVIYIGLTAREILTWYGRGDGEEEFDLRTTALIASDGVHPNRRCYTKWALSIANQLCDKIIPT